MDIIKEIEYLKEQNKALEEMYKEDIGELIKERDSLKREIELLKQKNASSAESAEPARKSMSDKKTKRQLRAEAVERLKELDHPFRTEMVTAITGDESLSLQGSWGYIIDLLTDDGPTEEIVRCRDCRHYDDTLCEKSTCWLCDEPQKTEPDSFCAWGEWKERIEK